MTWRACLSACAIVFVVASLGCSRRRTVAYGGLTTAPTTTTRAPQGLDAGLARFDIPAYFAPRDSRTITDHGITTTTQTWEANTGSITMFVASISRTAPFSGSRDQLLLDALGDRVRQGALGQVTFEFQDGLLIAAAVGQVNGQDAHVRAYLSRTRLVLIVCVGQPRAVRGTMASIVAAPFANELFFLPERAVSDDAPRLVWGLGFSCTMPGGVRHTESPEAWRYAADDATHTYEVVHNLGERSIEELSADALSRGTVIENTDDFVGGMRRRRVLTEVGGSWHAWQLAGAYSFHVSGSGTLTSEARAAATAFFDGCVF